MPTESARHTDKTWDNKGAHLSYPRSEDEAREPARINCFVVLRAHVPNCFVDARPRPSMDICNISIELEGIARERLCRVEKCSEQCRGATRPGLLRL